MKRWLFLLLLIPFFSLVKAQEGIPLSELIYSEHYFDNLEDALAAPEQCHYLDLAMQHPKLKTIPLEVYQLTQLRKLDAVFNQVRDVPDGIKALTELEELDLKGNAWLTSVSEELKELKKLKRVNVKATGLSSKQIEEIKSWVPDGCEVLSGK